MIRIRFLERHYYRLQLRFTRFRIRLARRAVDYLVPNTMMTPYSTMKAREVDSHHARWFRKFDGNGTPSHKLPDRPCPLYD